MQEVVRVMAKIVAIQLSIMRLMHELHAKQTHNAKMEVMDELSQHRQTHHGQYWNAVAAGDQRVQREQEWRQLEQEMEQALRGLNRLVDQIAAVNT